MTRFGLARRLSKLGLCSRTEAARWIALGRVGIDGRPCFDPEFPTTEKTRIQIDGVDASASMPRYICLNKPRGLVTSRSDEQGRDTVYTCLPTDAWLAPAGRLDKASEGLLLLSNDSAWSAWITSPDSLVRKTYHVKINRVPSDNLLATLRGGISDRGETLTASEVRTLRTEDRTAWLEFILHEGRNRHIRRMLEVLDIEVLRLVRVAIGGLPLGALTKGQWRDLSRAELLAAGLAAPNWLST